MINNIKITLPIIDTLKSYKKPFLKRDLIAGATVAAIAVPQAMAYAGLAGTPLVTGLYAALVAMIIYALFSTSRYVIVGPDAAMAALTGATLLPFAATTMEHYLSLVAVLAVLIGLVCLVAVYARLGFIAEFISRPILLGYMAGLAIAVITTQAPKLIGLSAPVGSGFFSTLAYIFSNINFVNLATIALSVILFILTLLFKKYIKRMPVSLLILVLATVASAVFDFAGLGIAIVGEVPRGLPLPFWPKISLSELQNLVVPALAIMVIAYANTIATARSFATKNKETIKTDQECVGLGVSNIAVGFFGGMPISASGARTAVNSNSRAASQVSQLVGAIFIGLSLLVLAPMLSYLPLAALAVIIVFAVSNLFDIKEFESIWHAWKFEAVLAIITVVGVTAIGIFQGLLLAVLLAVVDLIRRSAFPSDAVLGLAKDLSIRDIKRPPKTTNIEGIIMYRFDAPLYFANANYFRDRVYQLINTSEKPVHWFLWDAETITSIDSTAGQMLQGLIHDLKSQDITFVIARLKGPVRSTINHTKHLSRAMQNTPHFTSMGKALESYGESYPKELETAKNSFSD